jgi:hypothetical protein
VTSLWAIADSDARCAEQRRRHPFWLSRGTCGEVGQVVHAELRGGLSEALSAGGEESTEEATGFEFLEACLPALGGGAEAIENSGQLGGDHCFAFAKEPARVVDQ